MTTFKMPEPDVQHIDDDTDRNIESYSKAAVKKSMRDVLEQAAQLAEGALHFSEPIAKDIRSMKEQIK